MKHTSRQAQAVIDLTALKSNYQYINALAPNSKTIAVIKANAYEHGSLIVAAELEPDVPIFAVAFVDEALQLREGGIRKPILVLEGAFKKEDVEIALEYDLSLMLHSEHQIKWLLSLAEPYQGYIWLKVDTGMNRLGYKEEQITEVFKQLSAAQKEKVILCTHFSTADLEGNFKTKQQISKLNRLVAQYGCQFSMANSAGILNWSDSHGHYNRLGLALYGISPIKKNTLVDSLIPVMTLQASIIALRNVNIGETVGYGDTWQAKRLSTIAVIAIGYADGYPRNAKMGTPIYINGKIAPLAGRVSMDMITIDVTDIEQVNIGDCVELWGKNISIDIVAKYSNSISYELNPSISQITKAIY
jgi:alanine racemase